MILFFLDESGNSGERLDDEREPIHWLVAVAVADSRIQKLDHALYGAAFRAYGAATAHRRGFELKGSELFGGRGWAESLSPRQRIGCYADVVRSISEHDVKLFVRGIHKGNLAKRALAKGHPVDHPYVLAFQYLIERLDEWLVQRSTAGAQQSGLVVADEQQEVDRRMVQAFNEWSMSGTEKGYRARTIEKLIDTVHYVRSTDSRIVQLADCVAYLRNRIQKAGLSPTRPGDQEAVRLWQTWCVPHVVTDRIWP